MRDGVRGLMELEAALVLGLERFHTGQLPLELDRELYSHFTQGRFREVLKHSFESNQWNRLIQILSGLRLFVQLNFFQFTLDDDDDALMFSQYASDEYREQLSVDGEIAFYVKYPGLLVESIRMLSRDDWTWSSIKIWLARALFLHQKFLDNNVPTLKESLKRLWAKILSEDAARVSENDVFHALLYVEKALVDAQYEELDESLAMISRAEELLGLKLKLSGALGKRTKYQEESRTQMVLVIDRLTSPKDVQGIERLGEAELLPEISVGGDYLLDRPKLDEETCAMDVSVYENCLILARMKHDWSRLVDKELRREQLLVFLQKVLDSPSLLTLQFASIVFRSVIESEDWHYHERCLAEFDAQEKYLENGFNSSNRFALFFSLPFPTTLEFSNFHARFCEKLGLMQSALKIYERLNMWEQIMLSLVALGRPNDAKEMILERLESDPKSLYYCVLGDITKDASQYEKAWEYSKGTFARAKRSLGKYYYRQKDYPSAIQHLEEALKINPLFTGLWFTLGHAAMELENWALGATAFSRVVMLNSEHGEAWNNLALCHIHLDETDSAFVALKQSIRFKRQDWKVWDNYLSCAMRLKSPMDAIEALENLLQLKGAENLDLEVIRTLATFTSSYFQSLETQISRDFVVTRFKNLIHRIGAELPRLPEFWSIGIQFFSDINDMKDCADCLAQKCRSICEQEARTYSSMGVEAAMLESGQELADLIRTHQLTEQVYPAVLILRSFIGRIEKLELEDRPNHVQTLQALIVELEAMIPQDKQEASQDRQDRLGELYGSSSSLWEY